jgi:hypothetical protein
MCSKVRLRGTDSRVQGECVAELIPALSEVL